jgi:hypothetical protein
MNQNAKAEILRALTDAYGAAKAEALLAQVGLDRRTELAAQIFSAWVTGNTALHGITLTNMTTNQQFPNFPNEAVAAFVMADVILTQARNLEQARL